MEAAAGFDSGSFSGHSFRDGHESAATVANVPSAKSNEAPRTKHDVMARHGRVSYAGAVRKGLFTTSGDKRSLEKANTKPPAYLQSEYSKETLVSFGKQGIIARYYQVPIALANAAR